jgi:hypothetical protein
MRMIFIAIGLMAMTAVCKSAPTNSPESSAAEVPLIASCGPTPKVECSIARCGPNGWTFSPKPKGTSCTTAQGQPGVCSGTGPAIGLCVESALAQVPTGFQVGGYELDSSSYVSTQISVPIAGHIRYTLPPAAGFSSYRFTAGSQAVVNLCPHPLGNGGSDAQPAYVSAISSAITEAWVEVSASTYDFPIGSEILNETCHVKLANPYFETERVGSAQLPGNHWVSLVWRNNEPRAGTTTTVWRQSTSNSGQVGPWTKAMFFGAPLPIGSQSAVDPFAMTDALNCYRLEVSIAGGRSADTPVMCAYTQNNVYAVVSRLQLALTVAKSAGAGIAANSGVIPVEVRLQSKGPEISVPNGNTSWLDTTIVDFRPGQTQTYDLDTGNITQLSDITEITIAVPGSDDLCISHLTLFVDRDADPGGPYRIAFDKDFGSACTLGSNVAKNSDAVSGYTISIPFNELRASSDWQYQLANWDTLQSPLPHFTGYPAGNQFKAFLMGEFTSILHSQGASFADGHPIAISKGLTDDTVHARVGIHDTIDLNVDFDIVIQATYGCVYDASHSPPGTYNEISDTQIVLQNVTITPMSSLVTIGSDIVEAVTLGTQDISGYIQGKASAITTAAGKSPGAPGSFAYHYGFVPNGPGSAAGFTFITGQSPPPNPLCNPPT